MKSVTDKIKHIEQPENGYLSLDLFTERICGDTTPIVCSIKPLYVGKIIDDVIHEIIRSDYSKIFRSEINGYKTRLDWFSTCFSTGTKRSKQKQAHQIIEEDLKKHVEIEYMLSKLKLYAFDNDIKNMLNFTYGIVQYSIWEDDFGYISSRATVDDSRPKGLSLEDEEKLEIINMRTLKWLQDSYKKRIVPDFKFYPDGYSDFVKYGVGDFVCDNTLFDIKCIKEKPTIENTLQILMYYCMGLHSNNRLYKDIDRIGIYSPVTNIEWTIAVKDIPKESIDTIFRDILCYVED
jgi:hypothetical protein